ncbi:unnamed protein product [Phytophthora fragariaefolia]|uniref:Unnamed protein product n=1 Tax=Phytophthora fragariaefolia TaxID=1490495 RepID=A0A9W6XNK0_9STRA|nr:unnamed protein product [Phytophthora fragariaefolia]
MNVPREVSNLKDCRLSAEASAHDILSAMRGILTSRCPERPYNGLKKALAAEAEVPGKVTFAVFNDVLGDFGLALSLDHRSTLSSLFDSEMVGRISIEGTFFHCEIQLQYSHDTEFFVDFFIKLCGDAEAYEQVKTPQVPSPAPEPRPTPVEDPDPIVFTVKLSSCLDAKLVTYRCHCVLHGEFLANSTSCSTASISNCIPCTSRRFSIEDELARHEKIPCAKPTGRLGNAVHREGQTLLL